LSQTALRETQEEIGIDAKHVNIIGQMGHYQTVSNYVVTPFVAFVNAEHQLTIDANEVADVFEVPWHFFTKRVNHIQLMVRRQGQLHNIHFMPFDQRMIWGTTAAMINDLVSHFE
jgi:8-oxo-dGTP pyrophosphatase MutT (NUDIX family)